MPSPFEALTFKKGSYVAVSGQALKFVYIVQKGILKSQKSDVTEEEIELHPGDFINIESVLMKSISAETIYAVTACVLLAIRKEDVLDFLKAFPAISIKIMHYFSAKLRKVDELSQQLFMERESTNEDTSTNQEFRPLLDTGIYFFNSGAANTDNAYYIYHTLLTKHTSLLPEGMNEVITKRIETLVETRGAKLKKPYSPEIHSASFKANDLIIADGEIGEHAFIIEEGSVEIFKIMGNKKIVLDKLGKGQVFGEMALLESKRRTANVVSRSDETRLYIIPKAQFHHILFTQPTLAYRLALIFSKRIHTAQRKLLNRVIKDPVARVYDMLLIELEIAGVNFDSGLPYLLALSFNELCERAGVNENTKSIMTEIGKDEIVSFQDANIAISNISYLKRMRV